MIFAAAAAFSLPTAALAASPFDGTWKTDPASVTWAGKPTVYEATDKTFNCLSCDVPTKLPLGGTVQPYAGAPGVVDGLKAEKIDARTVRVIGLYKGVVFGTQTFAVSANGKMMTETVNRTASAPGLPAIHETILFVRKSAGAPGSLPQAGAWNRTRLATTTPALLEATYRVRGSTIEMSAPGGESYRAVFGGPPVPLRNEPGGITVGVRKMSDHEIIETEWRGGKKIDIADTTIAPDGKSAVIVDTDPVSGETSTAKAHKA